MNIRSARDSPRINLISFNENKPKKAFIVFGEHARELISPETGLHFIKQLCSGSDDNEALKAVRDNYEVRMILNANPLSRQKAE